jgi:hypothetical protein
MKGIKVVFLFLSLVGILSGQSFGQVTVIDDKDQGLACYKVTIKNAVFYLDKFGAGIGSLLDNDKVDWIGWNPKSATKGKGEYRGFPNAVYYAKGKKGYFHPKNDGTDLSSTKIVSQSSNKVVISATSKDGKWACTYTFYPTHLTWTMTKKAGSFWCLYEGTPGGVFDKKTDWWMISSSNKQVLCSTNQKKDIPNPEWIVFGDGSKKNRVLFLLHHQDDKAIDKYYPMKGMTVHGFGRNGLTKYLNSVPNSVSIGFLETTDYNKIKTAMQNILNGGTAALTTTTAPLRISQTTNTHKVVGLSINTVPTGAMPVDPADRIVNCQPVEISSQKW